MNKVSGRRYVETKLYAGSYRYETVLGEISVHRFEGKWYVRIKGSGGGLVAKVQTKAIAVFEVRQIIEDYLAGSTIRFLPEKY